MPLHSDESGLIGVFRGGLVMLVILVFLESRYRVETVELLNKPMWGILEPLQPLPQLNMTNITKLTKLTIITNIIKKTNKTNNNTLAN